MLFSRCRLGQKNGRARARDLFSRGELEEWRRSRPDTAFDADGADHAGKPDVRSPAGFVGVHGTGATLDDIDLRALAAEGFADFESPLCLPERIDRSPQPARPRAA